MNSYSRLKMRIDALGLRKDHIAKLLRISKPYLSQLLNGQLEFTDTLLYQINYIITTYEDAIKELNIA